MKLSALKTNVAVIEQGRWIDDIPGLPGVRLKVRGLGNADYRRAYDRKVSAVPASRRLRGLLPDDRERIIGECLAETVLLDWGGLTEDDGATPLAFTAELAGTLLLDPEFDAFRSAVSWAANAVSVEAEADGKVEEKN